MKSPYSLVLASQFVLGCGQHKITYSKTQIYRQKNSFNSQQIAGYWKSLLYDGEEERGRRLKDKGFVLMLCQRWEEKSWGREWAEDRKRREREGGCQRLKIESQQWERTGRTSSWLGEGKRQSKQDVDIQREIQFSHQPPYFLSCSVALWKTRKEMRREPRALTERVSETGSREHVWETKRNRVKEKLWRVRGWRRKRARDQSQRGMTGREWDGKNLLWIIICHIHPPLCSYSRVLLLILNRC